RSQGRAAGRRRGRAARAGGRRARAGALLRPLVVLRAGRGRRGRRRNRDWPGRHLAASGRLHARRLLMRGLVIAALLAAAASSAHATTRYALYPLGSLALEREELARVERAVVAALAVVPDA